MIVSGYNDNCKGHFNQVHVCRHPEQHPRRLWNIGQLLGREATVGLHGHPRRFGHPRCYCSLNKHARGNEPGVIEETRIIYFTLVFSAPAKEGVTPETRVFLSSLASRAYAICRTISMAAIAIRALFKRSKSPCRYLRAPPRCRPTHAIRSPNHRVVIIILIFCRLLHGRLDLLARSRDAISETLLNAGTSVRR